MAAMIGSAHINGDYFSVYVENNYNGKTEITFQLRKLELVDANTKVFEKMHEDLYSIESHIKSILGSNEFEKKNKEE